MAHANRYTDQRRSRYVQRRTYAQVMDAAEAKTIIRPAMPALTADTYVKVISGMYAGRAGRIVGHDENHAAHVTPNKPDVWAYNLDCPDFEKPLAVWQDEVIVTTSVFKTSATWQMPSSCHNRGKKASEGKQRHKRRKVQRLPKQEPIPMGEIDIGTGKPLIIPKPKLDAELRLHALRRGEAA